MISSRLNLIFSCLRCSWSTRSSDLTLQTWTNPLITIYACDPHVTLNKGLEMADLDAGRPAPDFELPRDGGQTVRLRRLRGKIVVLFFYPKDNTTGCTAEAIDFSPQPAAFRQRRRDSSRHVARQRPAPRALQDKAQSRHAACVRRGAQRHSPAMACGPRRTCIGRDYMGVVRTTFLIDRAGMIARIWRNVRVSGHAAEVLGAQSGKCSPPSIPIRNLRAPCLHCGETRHPAGEQPCAV